MSSKHNSGSYYVREAAKAGLYVTNGKGDHAKVYGPAGRGYMVVPLHRELATGTECAIRKWLKLCGVLLVLAALIAVAL